MLDSPFSMASLIWRSLSPSSLLKDKVNLSYSVCVLHTASTMVAKIHPPPLSLSLPFVSSSPDNKEHTVDTDGFPSATVYDKCSSGLKPDALTMCIEEAVVATK